MMEFFVLLAFVIAAGNLAELQSKGVLKSGQPSSCNVVSNSRFEEGTAGWQFWSAPSEASSASFAVDATTKFEGRASLRVESPDGIVANVFSAADLPCTGGKPYTLSAFVRTHGARDTKLAFWVRTADGKDIDYALAPEDIPANVPEFQRFSTSATLPETCAFVRPMLCSSGGRVWWAAIQLESGPSPTPYVPGWGPLEQRRAERQAAQRYAEAIAGQARLRDVVDQSERLAVYLREAGVAAHGIPATLTTLREDVGTLEASLQTNAEVPDFCALDYQDIKRRMSQTLSRATKARHRMVKALVAQAGWFRQASVEPRQPVLSSVDKRDLLDRFLLFPLIISKRDADYYGGEGNWDLLKPFGFEAVCPWPGVWPWRRGEDATDEPAETIIEECLARLDSLIAENAKHGLKTSIWIEPDRVVASLEKEYGEDIYLHDSQGRHFRRSRIHNSVNIWHPQVIAQLDAMMMQLGERYRNDPNVLCYEIFEESTLVLVDPHPAPGSKIEQTPGGYGDAASRAYRTYLEAKYETIETLNRQWGTVHKSFDVIDPPQKLAGPDINVAEVYDFGRFRTTSHAEFFARLVNTLQKADPVHAVVPQFIPMFYAWRDSGSDSFLMAQAGWDFYSTHDWPGQDTAWETAYTYSAALWAGKPLWNEEYVWSNWVRRDQGEVALWAGARCGVWRQFAWGKRCLELFEWDGEWNTEFEGDWNNALLNLKADKAIPRYAAGVFPVLAEKMDRLARFVYPTRVVNDGLGQLVPTASILASENTHEVPWWGQVIARALLAQHWTPLFFPEEYVMDGKVPLDTFKVIVAPPAPLAPDALIGRLLAWVEQGGTFIWVEQFGAKDELGRPTGRLDELVKPSRSSFRQGVKEVAFGAGQLVRISADVINREPNLLNRVVERAYPVRAVYSPSRDIELVLRQGGDGSLYLVGTSLDVARAGKHEIAVRGQWKQVVDLSIEGGAPVPAEYEGGCTRFVVRTGPGEGLLIRLSD